MCMFNEKMRKSIEVPKVFYKKFQRSDNGELMFGVLVHQTPKNGIPRGKWIQRKPGTPGFHAFATYAGAKAYASYGSIVRRVRLRGLVGVGWHNGHQGFRAKEMLVIVRKRKSNHSKRARI